MLSVHNFSVRQQGDANPDAWPRRRRQDDHPLQAETRPVREHHSHRRLQRRNRHLQERQIQRLGEDTCRQI